MFWEENLNLVDEEIALLVSPSELRLSLKFTIIFPHHLYKDKDQQMMSKTITINEKQ